MCLRAVARQPISPLARFSATAAAWADHVIPAPRLCGSRRVTKCVLGVPRNFPRDYYLKAILGDYRKLRDKEEKIDSSGCVVDADIAN